MKTQNWVKVRTPIMNDLGIGNLMTTLQGVGDIVNFSYYNEKDIPKLASMYFSKNYPQYIIYSKDFDLHPRDFNIIHSIISFWCLSVLNNAKNAGHRNVVRGTLSEGILMKALGDGQKNNEKKGILSFLGRNNK